MGTMYMNGIWYYDIFSGFRIVHYLIITISYNDKNLLKKVNMSIYFKIDQLIVIKSLII